MDKKILLIYFDLYDGIKEYIWFKDIDELHDFIKHNHERIRIVECTEVKSYVDLTDIYKEVLNKYE